MRADLDEGSGHRRIGLHRLPRRRQAARARARAGHLRPAALAMALIPGDRGHRARLDHRSRGARAGAALLRRRRPPGGRRRRQRRPRRRRRTPSASTPAGPSPSWRRPPRRGQAHRLRLDDLGLLRLRARRGRRGHAAAAAQPPLHQHQARGRAVLQGLPGALRDRLHDPALRDPVRSARPRGGGDPGVRRQGARRRAADARRRRRASRGGSSTSRTWPTASRAAWTPSPPTASTTWPATRP